MARKLVERMLRYDGRQLERARTILDTQRGDDLLAHMIAALTRAILSQRDIPKCALDVHQVGYRDAEFTFTALDTRTR